MSSRRTKPLSKSRPFRKFRINDLVDIQDYKGSWYEGEIKDVDCDENGNIDQVLVHYFFWDNTYDDWCSPTSNRIAPHCSQIWMQGKRLRVGHRVDVFDSKF